MTPESMGHDLTRNDPADQPRCPMEALADRFEGRPKPKWLRSEATRWIDGEVFFTLRGWVKSPDQLDDLIAFLQEVRG
jgi:hypothetical protein